MVRLRDESRRALSPDQLGSYVKVSRPSVWMLLAVIFALLVAGVAWFFAGTVSEGVSGPGVAGDDSCVVYVPLSRASEVRPGNPVTLSRDGAEFQGVVASVGGTPLSLANVERACGLSDLPSFSQDAWGVAVTVDALLEPGTYSVRIVTASHRPVMLLLGLD